MTRIFLALIMMMSLGGCASHRRAHNHSAGDDYAHSGQRSARDCKLRLQSIDYATTTFGSGLRIRMGRDCWWWYDRYGYGFASNYGYSTLNSNRQTLAALTAYRMQDEWNNGMQAAVDAALYEARYERLQNDRLKQGIAMLEDRIREEKSRIARLELELKGSRTSKSAVERELRGSRAKLAETESDLETAIEFGKADAARADEAEAKIAETEEGGDE